MLLTFQEKYCPEEEEKLLLRIKEVLKRLSEMHRDVLKYLFEFMLEISTMSDVNKMTPTNLAVVFGPSIFRCGEGVKGAREQVGEDF